LFFLKWVLIFYLSFLAMILMYIFAMKLETPEFIYNQF
jgi:hypothetical protein